MLKNSIWLILLLYTILGCKEKTKENNSVQSSNIENTVTPKNKEINIANERWKDYINQKSDSLSTLYTEHAVKVFEEGNTIVGSGLIKDHYNSGSYSISSIHSDKVILANQKRGLEYEMGEYVDQDNSKFKHITIWESKNSNRKRVFEFSAKIENSDIDLTAIKDRRDLWMKLCNEHNAEALINEMYSENTIYFNHKPLVIGRKGLIQDYQYMNNEKYKLVLNPIIVDQISADFVFEIGQCVGSYNGKYIIVWRKNGDGKWEVFIDSNI